MRYYPYGTIRTQEVGPGVTELPTDKLFTGQQQETADGLYHYGARLYNTDIARFPQSDTVIPNAFDPQTLNRYSYVGNNPTNYTDPTGHDFCLPCGGGGGGGSENSTVIVGTGTSPSPDPDSPISVTCDLDLVVNKFLRFWRFTMIKWGVEASCPAYVIEAVLSASIIDLVGKPNDMGFTVDAGSVPCVGVSCEMYRFVFVGRQRYYVFTACLGPGFAESLAGTVTIVVLQRCGHAIFFVDESGTPIWQTPAVPF